MRVDVHTHMLPMDCVREMQRLDERVAPKLMPDPVTGLEVGTIAGRPFGPFGRGMYDVEQRMREYRDRGIDVQAVSPIPFVFYYWLDAERAAAFARLLNDAIAEVARAYPQQCVALATVPLQDADAALRELERAMEQLGCRGVEIGTNVAGRNLDEPELEPFWAAAERLGAFVFVHPDQVAATERLQRHYLTNLIGNPLDTTIAIGSLVFGGVVERHPKLKLCFAHGGGFAPYQRGRLDHWVAQAAGCQGAIDRPPGQYLRQLHFDTILHDTVALEYLIRAFGSDHVLLGSDYPFDMAPDDPVGAVAGLDRLEQADRDAILGANAARLLGLG